MQSPLKQADAGSSGHLAILLTPFNSTSAVSAMLPESSSSKAAFKFSLGRLDHTLSFIPQSTNQSLLLWQWLWATGFPLLDSKGRQRCVHKARSPIVLSLQTGEDSLPDLPQVNQKFSEEGTGPAHSPLHSWVLR